MKRHISIVAALGMLAATFAGTAHADNNFSLHLEPGLAQPLTAPQSQLYNTGMVLGAKGLFAVDPDHILSVGPSVSAMYLPRAIDDGQNAGTLWQFDASARIQTDRRVSNKDELFSSFSPWLDMDLGLAATGNLLRPVFDVGFGAEVPTDENHIVWFGPFLRYTHVFQSAAYQGGSLLDPRDASILQAGVSFSFDTPTTRRSSHANIVQTITNTKVVHDVIHDVKLVHDQEVVVNLPPVFWTEKVYFDFDSATLSWESRDKLDAIVHRFNQYPHQLVMAVSGHASSDGRLTHNETLANKRTQMVVDYLTGHGVESFRLRGVSYGVSQPAAPNTTKEGRERNRRVEFTIEFHSVPQLK